jgi:serine/threonine protein kinase
MKIKHIPCGPFANESERGAIELLKSKLAGIPGDQIWILLSNLAFSANGIGMSDEIDLVLVGPSGVHVIEIKHWDARFITDKVNEAVVATETDKLTLKVKRLVGRLRKKFSLGFVQGQFLLTKQETPICTGGQHTVVRGCEFYGRRDWKELTGVESGKALLDNKTIEEICLELAPRSQAALNGEIRRFGNITNLELLSNKEDRFHRVYKGLHASRRDRVILHLYDYSASTTGGAPDKVAKREFDALQRLQKSPWLARIMDSFQPAADYPGELYYFSVVDPSAPTLRERAQDKNWEPEDRIATAINCVQALDELHNPVMEDCALVVHRNLNGSTIRVRANGNPIFTGLNLAKLADATTIASNVEQENVDQCFIAPEVLKAGLGVADTRSDVYSLCASLKLLFEGSSDLYDKANAVLDKGIVAEPAKRSTLKQLSAALKGLIGKSSGAEHGQELPAAVYWDEETEVFFKNGKYKIVGKLGSGGFGTTFKVLHVDKDSGEEFGTYVGKVIHKEEDGESAIRSYAKARQFTKQSYMSLIYDFAEQWKENEFVVLMEWVEGSPLSDMTGLVPLYAEDLAYSSAEKLVLRWLTTACDGLSGFHAAQLVHGDVSPRNIIVRGQDLVLTDYDLVTRAGLRASGTGTVGYCAPAIQNREAVSPSDDIFALAASIFHVLFDQEPFQFSGCFEKGNGVNWSSLAREEYPNVVAFIDKATHPNSDARFVSATDALKFLRAIEDPNESKGSEIVERTPNEVPWLLNLLSYPGSPYGNTETRGLDSEFAELTYVETALEEKLVEQITSRKVQLIILSGNAGDGKTAFLQQLGRRLQLPVEKSSKRIWDHKLDDGLHIRVNLDGSAAYQGKSAGELLDEFFQPFQNKGAPNFLVHLVAINSGPLQAWISSYESRHGETPLTMELQAALEGNLEGLDSRIRFVDLNNRSLVGGTNLDEHVISTEFVDNLIDKLLGGNEASSIWKPCNTCSAQKRCQVNRSVRLFGLGDSELKAQARQKLYKALQAVHQRGEVHITARELRATLSYILFGLQYCRDLHSRPDITPHPYFDLAFSPTSPNRQGEVLKELAYLDPALESHAQIDRYLSSAGTGEETKKAPKYPALSLPSARRRAYFEWDEASVVEVADDKNAMHLARGRHLSEFLKIGLMNDAQRSDLCKQLCRGISKLVDLPSIALQQSDVVPIRISPRTPTESAFWVNKPLKNFSIRAEKFTGARDLETLHTHIILDYQYADDRVEELVLNTELFNILMDLREGYQMVNATSDDTFANLAIFTQRLAQEDQRTLYAWNPVHERTVYELKPVIDAGVQRLVLKAAHVHDEAKSLAEAQA